MKTTDIAVLFLLIFCSGCEKPFLPQLPDMPEELVVNAQFSEGYPWKVGISHSRSVLSNDPFEAVSDAVVEIYEDEVLYEVLNYVMPGPAGHPDEGFFMGYSKLPRTGHQYRIVVNSEGFPGVMASDRVPEYSAFVEEFILEYSNPDEEIYNLTFRDLHDGANYYHILVVLQTYEYITSGGPDTTLTLLREEKARFQLKAGIESEQSGQITEGITTRNYEGLLLSDASFNLDSKSVRLEVLAAGLANPMPDRYQMGYIIELRTVTKAYYEYQKTIAQQQDVLGNPINSPIVVFNNIENGFGNFSGYTSSNSSVIWLQ